MCQAPPDCARLRSGSDRWPTGAVTSFLFGARVAGVVQAEVSAVITGMTDAMRRPSLLDVAAARALLAVPCAATACRAAASRAHFARARAFGVAAVGVTGAYA